MSTIASILAAEQAAFQALQIPSGSFAGAMQNFWWQNPNTTQQSPNGIEFSPYAASRAFAFAMQGFLKNGQSVPTWLMNMVSAYIGFEMAKLPWSQGLASAAGVDSTGYSYIVGDYLLTQRDGSVLALRHTYFNSVMQHQGEVVGTYSSGSGAGSYSQAVANVEQMFIKGCPYTKYGSTVSSGSVWPGFVTEQADFSFTVPLDQMSHHSGESNTCTASQSGSVVTVSSMPTSGYSTIGIGTTFTWPQGFAVAPKAATVVSFGTGSGGVGTYNVDTNQSNSSTNINFQSYLNQQYVSLDYHFYDANDSASSCLVALIALWLKQQSDSAISSWLQATVNSTTNWEALNWIMMAAYANYDPNTLLPFAAKFTRASFTQDTTEVIEGVRGFCWIAREMLNYAPSTFNTYSAGGFLMPTALAQWEQAVTALNAAVLNFCLDPISGLLTNGWNGDINASIGSNGAGDQAALEAWSSSWICSYDYSMPPNWRNSPNVDLEYLNMMKAQNGGAGFPTTSAWTGGAGPQLGLGDPNVYMYIVAAAAIGEPDAPFTLPQFETFINAVYTANTSSSPNRSPYIWWCFDSAALMWLCQNMMKAQNGGAGFPTTSAWTGGAGPQLGLGDPNVYMYIVAAAAIGEPDAPFTLPQFETFINAVYTANTSSSPNRSPYIWWCFDSAALMWLCQNMMKAQNGGAGFPTTSAWTGGAGPQLGLGDPNVYMYIVAAAAIGEPDAPFTLPQFETFINAVYTANTSSSPNRSPYIWWCFDSAALMWLCQNMMKAQNGGAGFPTTSAWTGGAGPQLGLGDPNVYMYIVAAAAIGEPDAPFTLPQFETFINAVYTANTSSSPNRSPYIWWCFDSAALMWLCQNMMKAQNGGAGFPTTSAWTGGAGPQLGLGDPNVYMYIVAAAAIGEPDAPFTLPQFETFINAVYTANTSSSPNRSPYIWWCFDSAALMWLCQNMMKAQNGGAGFPTTSAWTGGAGPQLGLGDPNVYMYIVAAAAIGEPDAPFTLPQFETFINAVYTANTSSSPNRSPYIWWCFDSAALMWLCQTLIARGAT